MKTIETKCPANIFGMCNVNGLHCHFKEKENCEDYFKYVHPRGDQAYREVAQSIAQLSKSG